MVAFSTFKSLLHRTNMIRLLIWILATTGFVWQVTLVTSQFMAYRVTTRLDISDAKTEVPPTVALCFGSIHSGLHELPVQALFDQVVDENTTIFALRYWQPDLSKYEYVIVPSEIHGMLNVTKYVNLQYICYSIDTIHEKINYYDLTDNFERPMFYRIIFNPLFKPNTTLETTFNYFYVCSKGSHFYGPSTTFAQTAFRFNYVTLGYKKYVENLLPPPYTTDCFDYTIEGFESKGDCYELCLQGKFKPHKVHPFDVVIDAADDLSLNRFVPLDYPSREDFMNQTNKYREDCRHECRHADCERNVYVPIVISINFDPTQYMVLELYVSNEPVVKIDTQANLAFIDFITYIFSCIGFWYAWSPVCLIPKNSGDETRLLRRILGPRRRQDQRVVFQKTNQVSEQNKSRMRMTKDRKPHWAVRLPSSVSGSVSSWDPAQKATFERQYRDPRRREYDEYNYRSYWTFKPTRNNHDKKCVCHECWHNRRAIEK